MSDPPSSHHRPFSISILILIMTIGSSSKTSAITSDHRPSSCAACKHQRRKCNPDCTLAPYFPANQKHQFLNAHRLFGVSNILKIIRHLDPVHRADAMRSIIFQSNARAQDPVGGCYRIIRDLECQLQCDSAELALVRCELAIYRSLAPDQANIPGLRLKLPDDDGGGGVDHHDYGHADGIFISTTNSINKSKNYRDSWTTETELLTLKQQQCTVEEKNTKPLVDIFDIRRDMN